MVVLTFSVACSCVYFEVDAQVTFNFQCVINVYYIPIICPNNYCKFILKLLRHFSVIIYHLQYLVRNYICGHTYQDFTTTTYYYTVFCYFNNS